MRVRTKMTGLISLREVKLLVESSVDIFNRLGNLFSGSTLLLRSPNPISEVVQDCLSQDNDVCQLVIVGDAVLSQGSADGKDKRRSSPGIPQ